MAGTARLNGGPLDGLIVRGVDHTARPTLLMPTNRDACTGDAPPTAPYFAEYRHTGQFDTFIALYGFVGLGMNVEAEEVSTDLAVSPTLRNPLVRPALPRGITE